MLKIYLTFLLWKIVSWQWCAMFDGIFIRYIDFINYWFSKKSYVLEMIWIFFFFNFLPFSSDRTSARWLMYICSSSFYFHSLLCYTAITAKTLVQLILLPTDTFSHGPIYFKQAENRWQVNWSWGYRFSVRTSDGEEHSVGIYNIAFFGLLLRSIYE